MPKKFSTEQTVAVIIIAVLLLVVIYNTTRIMSLDTGKIVTGLGTVSASEIIPKGVPALYGSELGISYDDVSPANPRQADATINVLSNIDRTTTLTGNDLQRYINILYHMHGGLSCEFCCGARSIIFENGEMACGCAHSFAMRGLTKYLILNSDMSNDKIFEEVGKWKVLFFPGIHEGKAEVMKSQGIEVNYTSLTSNEYRGIEKGQATGGMVGGC